MSVSSADRIADSLISLAYSNRSELTNLKLQKLLYYSQAWHLALFGKTLFEEDFEAWVHGPVVPAIFRKYRSYKWGPIANVSDAPQDARAHLEEVWRVYGSLSAFDLERLTHSEEPWKQARNGLAPDASSHEVITKRSMQTFYSTVLHEQQKT